MMKRLGALPCRSEDSSDDDNLSSDASDDEDSKLLKKAAQDFAPRKKPTLADSDIEIWTDYLGDYINMWVRNGPRFFEDQKYKMIRLSLCPFLFGISDNLPIDWINVLHNVGMLEKDKQRGWDKRGPMDHQLSSTELETFEMAEIIFKRCADLTVENKKDLKEILNFIYDVEVHSNSQGGAIDANYALEKLSQLKLFPSIWASFKGITAFERRKKQAHVCILYFFKTIHHQVVHYGRDGSDKYDLLKRAMSIKAENQSPKSSTKDAEAKAKQAHAAFKDRRFPEALQLYSQALKFEVLNSQHYSNRANTNIKLEKYADALSDCWRAIILDQKNSSKSCFRAANCYLKLDRLEKAEELNDLAMEFCVDAGQKQQIQMQNSEIKKARRMQSRLASHNGLLESENGNQQEAPGSWESAVKFRRLQHEGSMLYQNRKYADAAEKFHKALDLLASNGVEAPENHLEDALLLNYCYGVCCVRTTTYYNLQAAIEKFKYVISQSSNFPAAYYGLGLAYKALNRFTEGLEEFQKALQLKKTFQVYHWPQTMHVIEETDPDKVKKLLKERIQECINPPKPDAICRFHSDVEGQRKEIYHSDPDYKGFVQLRCTCDCCVEFHSACWKTYKHNTCQIHTDKEMLDLACATPNCWGTIHTIHIHRQESDIPVTLESTKEKDQRRENHIRKPMLKMKTTSEAKILKKEENKRLRKERREEEKRKQAELLESEAVAAATSCLSSLDIQALDVEDTRNAQLSAEATLLKKDAPEVLLEGKNRQKTVKSKKKKEKTKQVLTFDLQFSVDKDKELLGINSLDDEGDYMTNQPGLLGKPPELNSTPMSNVVAGNPLQPSSLNNISNADNSFAAAAPISISRAFPQPSGNGLLPIPLKPLPKVDIFTKNLLECLSSIVQGGPIPLNSAIVRDVLANAPEETRARVMGAGGLTAFLGQHPQFEVANGMLGQPGSTSDSAKSNGVGLLGPAPSSGVIGKPGAGLLGPAPIGKLAARTAPAPSPGLVSAKVVSPWGMDSSTTPTSTTASQLQLLKQQQQQQLQKLQQQAKAGIIGTGSKQQNITTNAAAAPPATNPWTEKKEEKKEERKTAPMRLSPITITLNPTAQEFVPISKRKSSLEETSTNSHQRDDKIDSIEDVDDGDFVTVTSRRGNSAVKHSNISKTKDNQSLNSTIYDILYKEEEANGSMYSLDEITLPKGKQSGTNHSKRLMERRTSDASSSVSEEPRACSPATSSSPSRLSQGSGGSKTASSSTSVSGPPGAAPLKPLKPMGLNLPKRSKKKDLREKLATRSSSQPSSNQTAPFDMAVGGFDLTDLTEGDDAVSICSSSSGGTGSGVFETSLPMRAPPPVDTSVNAVSSLLRDLAVADTVVPEELDSSVKDNHSTSYGAPGDKTPNFGGGLANGLTSILGKANTQTSGAFGDIGQARKLSKSDGEEKGAPAGLSQSSSFFPGMYDYNSSLGGIMGMPSVNAIGQEVSSQQSQRESRESPQQHSRVLKHLASSSSSTGNSPRQSPSPRLQWKSDGPTESEQLQHSTSDFSTYNKAVGSVPNPGGEYLKDNGSYLSSGSASFLQQGTTALADTSDKLFVDRDLWPKSKSYETSAYSDSNAVSGLFGSQLFLGGSTRHFTSEDQGAAPTSLSVGGASGSRWSPISMDTYNKTSTAVGENPYSGSIWPTNFGNITAVAPPNKFSGFGGDNKSLLTESDSDKVKAAANTVIKVETATASVNTELTMDKLKALQQKYYEVREERDSLRENLKASQQSMEMEKAHRAGVEERLLQVQASLTQREVELHSSKQQLEIMEKDREDLKKDLMEMKSKEEEWNDTKTQFEKEITKTRSYEKQILNLHLQAALSSLDLRRKEGFVHVHRISGIIQKIRENGRKEDQSLRDKLEEWKSYVSACEKAMKEVSEECKQRIQAVDGGQHETIDQLLPLPAPSLPSVPKPPSEQSLVPVPLPQQPAVPKVNTGQAADPFISIGSSAPGNPDTPSDDADAYLKMVFNDTSTSKLPDRASSSGPPSSTSTSDDNPLQPPVRLPPGLPRRPLSQGPMPLPNAPLQGMSALTPRKTPAALKSVKLPMARPSLASISSNSLLSSNSQPAQSVGAVIRPPGFGALTPQATSAAVQKPQQPTIFDRLVMKVQETYPNHSREQIMKLVEEVRKERQGSLGGLSFESIAQFIVEKITDADSNSFGGNLAVGTMWSNEAPQGASSSGLAPNGRSKSPDESNVCTICTEDASSNVGVRILDCGHRFHENCIQSWLRVNQTCPNCRSHSLLQEDFPSLRYIYR